ncbi:hypothetical protein OPV22_020522 [Ensete ventricosum]|uniref:Uncharacterized protein n=1 Tax=Ensete ventricosum TaxID=4639 RepID=A0AAV8PA89_ENSVE|nr:hypothetical protein OPV22_020522 [Ensete ventricosum]
MFSHWKVKRYAKLLKDNWILQAFLVSQNLLTSYHPWFLAVVDQDFSFFHKQSFPNLQDERKPKACEHLLVISTEKTLIGTCSEAITWKTFTKYIYQVSFKSLVLANQEFRLVLLLLLSEICLLADPVEIWLRSSRSKLAAVGDFEIIRWVSLVHSFLFPGGKKNDLSLLTSSMKP